MLQEKFLLASWANPTELARTMSKFGKNSAGLRVVNGFTLAQQALMRNAIFYGKQFVDSMEAGNIVYKLFHEKNAPAYFSNSSYADACEFVRSMSSLRMLIPGDEKKEDTELQKLLKGPFGEKNEAILGIFKKYKKELEDNKKIDMVGTIRLVLSSAIHKDMSVQYCREFPLNPLEKALAEHVSASPEEIALDELFPKKKLGAAPVVIKAFGRANEVEYVLEDIYRNHSLDCCCVAVTDTSSYGQLFYEYSNHEPRIPMTFGCGIPVLNTNAARLALKLLRWNTVEGNCKAAINEVIYSLEFDRSSLFFASLEKKLLHEAVDLLGTMRISFNRAENKKKFDDLEKKATLLDEVFPDIAKALPVVKALAAELEKGYAYLIETYTRADRSAEQSFNRKAKQTIVEALKTSTEISEQEEILRTLFSGKTGRFSSAPGSLFIYSILGSISSLREHLYIVGLNAGSFPGTSKENFLLLDKDFELFGDPQKESYIPTSENLMRLAEKQLEILLELATKLGISVTVTYPYFETSELKQENPSAVLLRNFCSGKDYENYIRELKDVRFFDTLVSKVSNAGKKYCEDNISAVFAPSKNVGTIDEFDLTTLSFSPSAIDAFFTCPKKFFYKSVMHLFEPDNTDDDTVIPANLMGTLVHAAMENYDKTVSNDKDVMKRASEICDLYHMIRVPLSNTQARLSKEQFLDHVKNAIALDTGRKPFGCEVGLNGDIDFDSGEKLSVHGRVDRIEEDVNDGTFHIIDYKTGKLIEAKKDDLNGQLKSYLQIILYGYLLYLEGRNVTGGEYHFTSSTVNKSVIVSFSDYAGEMVGSDGNTVLKPFEKLKDFMKPLYDALKKKDFPAAPSKVNCGYCPYKSFCENADRNEVEEV